MINGTDGSFVYFWSVNRSKFNTEKIWFTNIDCGEQSYYNTITCGKYVRLEHNCNSCPAATYTFI